MGAINSPIKQYPKNSDGSLSFVYDQTTARSSARLKYLISEFNNFMTFFWNNPDGYSPQEVFNKAGVNGGWWFQAAGALATLINSIEPGSVDPTPPRAYSVDANGNVTVS